MIVSVVVPCRNEWIFIENFINSTLAQETENFECQIVIADGESDDGTREILDRLSADNPSIEVVNNPGRIVSTGLNLATSRARGEIIVRMDVHTVYNLDYILQCAKVLKATHAQCVGGAWRAKGIMPKQKAIADAFQSPIGSGGAQSRLTFYEGPCDTVYLGCWWKKDLLGYGGFDELLVRNQDDELCLRIRKKGGMIWQSASIKSEYVPRSSFRSLFKQFSQYGYWKVAVAKKHGVHGSWRHIIPFLFLATNILLFSFSLIFHTFIYMLIALNSIYLITLFLSSVISSNNKSYRHITMVCYSIVLMHLGYGTGYSMGLLDFIFVRGIKRYNMNSLSR
jgi:succinoglycan biosynthesis protein ExoA